MLSIIFRGHRDPGFFGYAVSRSHEGELLALLPDNQRTDEARYACTIPIFGCRRMVRADARACGDWHYSDLEPEILGDVRAGRCVLVFDLSNEGPAYDRHIFEELYSWIEANSLPPGRCVCLTQNQAIAKAARAHCGARSELVRFEYYCYFAKILSWIFSPYSQEQVLGTDPEAAAARLFDLARKDKLLLCLNATPRLQRVLTVAALHHYNLIEDSLVSFPGMQYVKDGDSMARVIDFIGDHGMLDYLSPSIEAVSQMTKLKVDSFEEKGNDLVFKIDPSPYERSFFSLVTESDLSDGEIERVTEKIMKAYCMGHPALVIGNPHSVKFMTEMGFQDWGGVLDRSAESMFSPAERFEMVMSEVLRQASRVRSDPQGWLESVREVSAYNIRHAVSGRFLADRIRRMDRPLIERLEALVAA